MKTMQRSGSRDSSVRRQASGSNHTESGFSLVMVLFFIGVGFLVMSGVLQYSGASSTVNARYNEYYTTLAAAEAATEGVIAKMARDFQSGGSSTVDGSIANYRTMVPTAVEAGDWGNYQFADASGGAGQTHVSKVLDWGYTNLNWKYSGFFGSNATYRVISNTRNTVSGNSITAAVKQDIQLASIPLFEFGVFYALDMELNPAETNCTVTGRVHSNGSIYCKPNLVNVTFRDHVTAAGQIVHDNHPSDSWSRTFGSVTYVGERDSKVPSLNLPIGTTNSDLELHKIIEVPSVEGETTLLGKQRYYNKADLIILVSNGGVVGKKGAPSFLTVFPNLSDVLTNFVRIDGGTKLFNKREGMYIKYTELNIGAFIGQTNTLNTRMGYVPKNIYIADQRTQTGTQPGVTITNGQTLPLGGLTIATMNPLYVVGHFNAPAADLGTTNTSATKPASLIADAITIVSSSWDWNDANYGVDPRNQNAIDTTVNAAIIAGICPTAGGSYGGGVENCLRFLEDWNPGSAVPFTFNGSIVVLFSSQIAVNSTWEDWWDYMWTDGNGMLPNRQYGFDPNFKVVTKLPPGTPYLRTFIRGEWAITQANSTL